MKVTRTYVNKLDADLSLLGFGCMRFPTLDGKINEPEAEKMLDEAYAAGINYFDTAYPYHNGDSEPFVGKVLNKYPRDSYYVATKLPIWLVNTIEEVEAKFEEQLKRLDKEYVDFYLIHGLSKDRWEKVKELGVVELLEQKQKEGKIKYLGFSFHDEYEAFEEIITARDWDFCQIQLNYMDTDEQAGMKGYKLAEERNVPLVIMEPVKGGLLAGLPEDVAKKYKEMHPDASIASWALRWIASLPNVKVVLSGMSTKEQVEDNLKTFTDFKEISEEEKGLIEDVAGILHSRVNNGCTGCRYCMPCPAGVNIPANFKVWNRYGVYGDKKDALAQIGYNLKEEEYAEHCVKCGACEEQCPQKLSIREDLVKVTEMMKEIKG